MPNDDLAEVRQDMASNVNIYLGNHIRKAVEMGMSPPDGSGFITANLNIKVKSGDGKCPECKGSGEKWKQVCGMVYPHADCPTCKGTGTLPVKEKSIGELIKEYKDGS